MVHWEAYLDTEDSCVKEADINGEMVRVYMKELEEEVGENKSHKLAT